MEAYEIIEVLLVNGKVAFEYPKAYAKPSAAAVSE